MSWRRPAASIRRHLQATSLLAVLAGYVLLLLVNRELAGRLRQQRHWAQVQAAVQALTQLPPEQLADQAALQRQLADAASPALLLSLQPLASAEPPLRPSGALFQHLPVPAARMPGAGAPHELQLGERLYWASALPIQLAGRDYQLQVLQDMTLELQQEQLLTLLLVALAGVSALFTSALLRLVIHRGLLPLDAFSATLEGISSNSLSTERLALRGQPAELRPIARAFNDLLDRLAEAWEHQRTFVNGVSHELRTPITLISGYGHRLLRRASGLSPDQREQLQLVVSEADGMGRLVNDLLEIARDDAGHLQLESRPLDPAALLRELQQRLQPTSGDRLQLHEPPAALPAVCADPERLSQCLTNLIENALKYSPAEQSIELALSLAGEELVLHVMDHGPGVPEVERQRIFGRFVRGSGSSASSGHGIGLAVVKTLMERMGGRALVEAAPGGGADFQLRLPFLLSTPLESPSGRSASLRRWLSPG